MKAKRILLKLSGEALKGNNSFGISSKVLTRISKEIHTLIVEHGIQIGIVLGGGNLFRGENLSKIGINRVTGDHMGMLATVMNGLALRDALQEIGVSTRLMSAMPITGIAEECNTRMALHYLKQWNSVIFSGGTGNPFFTTDTNACLRGIEIEADVIMKATKVDGIYSDDPKNNPDAIKYKRLTYDEILEKKLKVMDLTAICLARDNSKILKVFDITQEGNLLKALIDPNEGTIVSN